MPIALRLARKNVQPPVAVRLGAANHPEDLPRLRFAQEVTLSVERLERDVWLSCHRDDCIRIGPKPEKGGLQFSGLGQPVALSGEAFTPGFKGEPVRHMNQKWSRSSNGAAHGCG